MITGGFIMTKEKVTGTIKKSDLIKLLKEKRGRFIKVIFVKKGNGQLRTMVGRQGVHKFSHGGINTIKDHSDIIKLYEQKMFEPQGQYRNVNINQIIYIKAGDGLKKVINDCHINP